MTIGHCVLAVKSPIILFTGIVLFLFMSCEERVNISPKSETTNLLVVEGVLTNEKINHQIKLSHPYQTSNGNSAPASGAVVLVSDGTAVFPLAEIPAGSGIYRTDSIIAVVGRSYTLTIQYQGRQYFAQDSSVPVEPMEPLQYRAANDSLYYTLTLNPTGVDANYVQHQISWKNTGFCGATDSCDGEIIYYDLKTIDVNQIFKPSKDEFDFPVGTMVIRTKYSTSSAYRAFLRGVLSETEWRGGIFDVERANAPTNLSDGAIGFFAVSTVVSDTTFVVP